MLEYNDNLIIDFFKQFKKIKWDKIETKYSDVYNYLINRFNDSESIKESYYRILNNIDIRPTCIICNNHISFNNRAMKFNNTCSKKCTNILRYNSIKKTNQIKYGVDNIFASDQFKNKLIENNFKLYDVKYTWQRDDVKEKIKQTCFKKYGVTNGGCSKEALEKIKQTTLKHYGVEYSLSSPEIREKIKQTCLKKYGVTNGGCSKEALEKIKQTTLEHYNVEYSLSSPEIREKIKQTCLKKYGGNSPFSSDIVKNKAKQNAIKKYGVDCWQKTKEGRLYMSNKISSSEIQEKINNTKRKNNSFNLSSHEKYIYQTLLKYFPDVKYQYCDKLRYPFKCDFYIPSEDLFIEYNGSWVHGGKLFEGTKEDLKIINNWKEKNTKYYNNAIYVWTTLDVRKNNTAMQNKLNYLKFYTLNEFNNWINNL